MDVTQISNLSEPDNSGRARKVSTKKENASKYKNEKVSDKVSISEGAKAALEGNKFLKTLEDLPSVRQELVDKLKEEVENDTLLSSEAIEQTAEKVGKGLTEGLL